MDRTETAPRPEGPLPASPRPQAHSPGTPPEAKGRILVIDDDPFMARLTETLLRHGGYMVDLAGDAAQGMARAQDMPPDVILLDIEMPDLNGIEACKRLKSIPSLSRVPVMFFSAGAKDQFIKTGFQAGAHDYLEKPFTGAELLARVANLTRLARYEQSLRDTARELKLKNDLLSRELEAARQVQGALLPTSLSLDPSLTCAVLYEPMVGVGGDLYDLALSPDGTIRFLVADVSGHGVFAALLAAFFKMGYQVYSDREQGPAGVLSQIHREMCRSLEPSHFVTALIGWLDPRSGTLRYASAAHVPGLLHRSADGRIERLMPTGPVVGILEGSTFEEGCVVLRPDDALILLTDGVLEAQNPTGETFGLRKVEGLATRLIHATPAELLQHLRIELDAFQGPTPLDDDMTALTFRWNPEAP
jgi:two-component system, sensor histidine kinase ChiS